MGGKEACDVTDVGHWWVGRARCRVGGGSIALCERRCVGCVFERSRARRRRSDEEDGERVRD